MQKNRLESFTDGVTAIIIITIIVLEVKVPTALTWPRSKRSCRLS